MYLLQCVNNTLNEGCGLSCNYELKTYLKYPEL